MAIFKRISNSHKFNICKLKKYLYKKQFSEPHNVIGVRCCMKNAGFINIFLVLLTLSFAIFAVPDGDKDKKKAKSDTTNQSSPAALTDSSKTLSDTTWLSTVKGKAMARLSTWDNQEITANSVQITVEQQTPELMLQEMTRKIMTSDPEDTPDYDFRSNTAYRTGAAQGFVTPEHLKRNDILWVNPRDVVKAASKALKNGSGETPISLSENEITILKILWRNPNISAKQWYKFYSANISGKRMSFFAFVHEANILAAKELIKVREIEDVQYFSPTISRGLLVWLAKQELISSDVIFNTVRHYELLKMRESLEDSDLKEDSNNTP